MKMYHVDAFTDQLFKGNPADVCFVDQFPSDELMQAIAIENRLSETAFVVARNANEYDLRWFTPAKEIDLCGHATLATAYCVFRFKQPTADTISFHTKSGVLTVKQAGSRYQMNFPSYQLNPIPVTDQMTAVFGVKPLAAYLDRDLLCVLPDEKFVEAYQPDPKKLAQLPGLLQNITAPSNDPQYDCVSRCFGPKLDAQEDPVTGSAHCQIVPYWSQKLGKKDITGFQASPRSGVLYCENLGDRVSLAGDAVLYAEAELNIE